MRRFLKPATVLGVIAVLIAMSGTAVAGSLITSANIKDGTIKGRDIRKGAVTADRLASDVKAQLTQAGLAGPKGSTGPAGPKGDKGERGEKGHSGVTDLESDGPYPGATQLANIPGNHGKNSTAAWDGDTGVALQQSWVRCADGKTAIGGGFSRADEGAAAFKDLQVVTSSPALIADDGEIISITGNGLEPKVLDEAWSIKPNGWVVEGFNNGVSDLIVRPWVVCAKVG